MIEEINKENQITSGPLAKSNFEQALVEDAANDDKKKKDGKKPLWRKIVDWVVTGVFGAAALGAIAIMITTKVNPDQMIFGRIYPQVLTDSMADKYPVGTVLVVEKIDPSEIKVGDAVTFKWNVNGQEMNMTHEIFKIEYDETKSPGESGYYIFSAHGTNKHSEWCKIGEEYGDCTDTTKSQNVQRFIDSKVVGKVTGTSPVLKAVFTVVQSPIGLIVLILLPCLYLMVTSVIDMFKKIPDDEEEVSGGTVAVKKVTRLDGSDPLAGLTEEEKERLKKEMLDELLGKKGGK